MARHVVIVDDQRVNLRVLGAAADPIPDVAVHPFLRSSEALLWARDRDVDCFVLDYQMPAPDGLAMIRRIRGYDAFVPIVIVTAESDRQVIYEAFRLGANDFVQKPIDPREFGARLKTLLDLRAAQKALGLRIESLEASLRASELRARRQAERLEALWRLFNDPALAGAERSAAMLREAAAGIRPGRSYRALLGRLSGTRLVVEELAEAPGAGQRRRSLQQRGEEIVLPRALTTGLAANGGRARSWDDLRAQPIPGTSALMRSWRACIVTTFPAGGDTFVLAFLAAEPNDDPFGREDHAYVEIVAGFFANERQQQWQAERIAYQQSHDSLTGVLSRASFRSAVRMASAAGIGYGLAVVDLAGFRVVNERYGHMIGDALLVEVAAALRGCAAPEGLVGRLGGDVFGVFVPNVDAMPALRERAAALLTALDAEFSTGDRERKVFVHLAARCGVALASAGSSFESVLTAADEALALAKQHGEPLVVRA